MSVSVSVVWVDGRMFLCGCVCVCVWCLWCACVYVCVREQRGTCKYEGCTARAVAEAADGARLPWPSDWRAARTHCSTADARRLAVAASCGVLLLLRLRAVGVVARCFG